MLNFKLFEIFLKTCFFIFPFVWQSFKIIERMKNYAKYCNNYDSAETLYKQKIKKSRDFEAFVNVSNFSSVIYRVLQKFWWLGKMAVKLAQSCRLLTENIIVSSGTMRPSYLFSLYFGSQFNTISHLCSWYKCG